MRILVLSILVLNYLLYGAVCDEINNLMIQDDNFNETIETIALTNQDNETLDNNTISGQIIWAEYLVLNNGTVYQLDGGEYDIELENDDDSSDNSTSVDDDNATKLPSKHHSHKKHHKHHSNSSHSANSSHHHDQNSHNHPQRPPRPPRPRRPVSQSHSGQSGLKLPPITIKLSDLFGKDDDSSSSSQDSDSGWWSNIFGDSDSTESQSSDDTESQISQPLIPGWDDSTSTPWSQGDTYDTYSTSGGDSITDCCDLSTIDETPSDDGTVTDGNDGTGVDGGDGGDGTETEIDGGTDGEVDGGPGTDGDGGDGTGVDGGDETDIDGIPTDDGSSGEINVPGSEDIPIEPTDPIQPIDPIEPTDPIDPIDPIHPIDPIEPIEPTDPIQPIDPIEPIDPIQPIDPIEPIEPIYDDPIYDEDFGQEGFFDVGQNVVDSNSTNALTSDDGNSSKGCFPEETQVFQQSKGKISISKIQVGDLIETLDCFGCESYYTEVIGWLHKDEQIFGEYLELLHENGQNIFASPFHNIALKNGQYVFAKDTVGRILMGTNNIIMKSQLMLKKGVYAPMTNSGNFLIAKGQTQKVLVHCFSNIRNPTYYEPFIKLGFHIWGPSNSKIHPIASILMKIFNFLIVE